MSADSHALLGATDRPAERLPPVTELAIATLALVVAGGVYMAAHIPGRVPLGPAVGLAAAALAVLVVNVAMLSRVSDFAWPTFTRVAGWTLLAYLVIAGMLEYVFVYDHTPGRVLALLSGMLAVFAVNVPLVLGFTVARYQTPASATHEAVGT
ncbi:MAG TPA: hypothetical protein VMV02_01710 [Acidimicrobiales bacterium]|nr:hypothetical protein [Acidimicrobiales bacterium]